jgi:hypothetical protein
VRLLRLKADGFGALRGEYVFDPDRVTLIVDENERGKSTLLAALAAGLYGIVDDRRSHRTLTPAERWRPWGGGPYRIELEIATGGGRLTIARDFERGTVEVWNERGQEITHEFREGKDSYPVGSWLLGLDADEFEKCALLRHDDLDQVVAADEKARRHSTLHARLECAADTRGGDQSAVSAIRTLTDAVSAFRCPELDATLKIENAIARLESKCSELAIESSTLSYDLERMAPELEEMAALAEEERRTRAGLDALETEQRARRADEARIVLDEDDRRRAEVATLRGEAACLQTFATVRTDAEALLRAAHARLDEAEQRKRALATKRGEADDGRARIQNEVEALRAYAACTEEDAVLLGTVSARLRIAERERERLRAELAGRDPELSARFERLARVFAARPKEELDLLRSQTSLQLSLEDEAAALERARAESLEARRRIDAARRRRQMPGGIVAGLGVALAAGGAVAGALGLQMLAVTLAGAVAAVIVLIGVVLLAAAGRWRRAERDDAEDRLREAEAGEARVAEQRRSNEERLRSLAAELGHSGGGSLYGEWVEYQRLLEESPQPAVEERLAECERQCLALRAEARQVIDRTGGGPTDPETLDQAAIWIRRLVTARHRLAEFDRNWAWLQGDERAAQESRDRAAAEVARVLEAASCPHLTGRALDRQLSEIGERVRARTRHEHLVTDLIPRAERDLLDPRARAELSARIDDARGSGTNAAARAHAEIEADMTEARRALDAVMQRRGELRLGYEQRSRDCRNRLADLPFEIARIERALDRAHRFKRSVELARRTLREVAHDTHRRWAEFLNRRVAEIVTRMGGAIEQVRFGEDLDFAVKPSGGPQLSRGKALLQLSSGARDQLHLAVRLAIGEYLSRDKEPLPFLVDDCFARSDDERARAGMRLLIEHFGRDHQVIVVTCQRRRFEALAELDPELYASRVQRLDARFVEVG